MKIYTVKYDNQPIGYYSSLKTACVYASKHAKETYMEDIDFQNPQSLTEHWDIITQYHITQIDVKD